MIQPQNVAAILLASGQSKRFGDKDKLSEPIQGLPIVMHSVRRIIELKTGWRIAVCQENWLYAEELARMGFEIQINNHPERGLSSSLALGIAAAARTEANAALVVLGDMPFVSDSLLRKLLIRFDQKDSPVIASSRDGIAMPPALFAKCNFDLLLESKGDKGGRSILRQGVLVTGDPDELRDIDRPEDLLCYPEWH